MFDAHCHLQFEVFDGDRDSVIRAARHAGVRGVIVADFDSERRPQAADIAARNGIWRTVGLHPWAVHSDTVVSELDAVESALVERRPDVCGIGETGLDWFTAKSDQDRSDQILAFRRHLALARDHDLPIVLHCVRAHHEVLRILKEDGAPRAGGMAHGFVGSVEDALAYLKHDFDISVGTGVVRRNSGKMVRVVRQVPLASLLVETDSPDQSVQSDERNEPRHVVEAVRWVADIIGLSAKETGRITEENSRRRFRLGEEELGDRQE